MNIYFESNRLRISIGGFRVDQIGLATWRQQLTTVTTQLCSCWPIRHAGRHRFGPIARAGSESSGCHAAGQCNRALRSRNGIAPAVDTPNDARFALCPIDNRVEINRVCTKMYGDKVAGSSERKITSSIWIRPWQSYERRKSSDSFTIAGVFLNRTNRFFENTLLKVYVRNSDFSWHFLATLHGITA